MAVFLLSRCHDPHKVFQILDAHTWVHSHPHEILTLPFTAPNMEFLCIFLVNEALNLGESLITSSSRY